MPNNTDDASCLMKSSRPKYVCSYELDERPDLELTNLFQEAYRSIQDNMRGFAGIRIRKGRPDAVQCWVLYLASLVHGSADAALTLVLHNLGREAQLLERQIFEYVVRAYYYANHRRRAEDDIESEPLQEKRLLDDLAYDKRSKRYRAVARDVAALMAAKPHFATHREAPFPKMLGKKSSRRMRLYAHYYRLPSQVAHASILGMREIFTEDGISFDSRRVDPNLTLESMTRNVILLLSLQNTVLHLSLADEIDELRERFKPIQHRVFAAYKKTVKDPHKV